MLGYSVSIVDANSKHSAAATPVLST